MQYNLALLQCPYFVQVLLPTCGKFLSVSLVSPLSLDSSRFSGQILTTIGFLCCFASKAIFILCIYQCREIVENCGSSWDMQAHGHITPFLPAMHFFSFVHKSGSSHEICLFRILNEIVDAKGLFHVKIQEKYDPCSNVKCFFKRISFFYMFSYLVLRQVNVSYFLAFCELISSLPSYASLIYVSCL